MRKEKKKEKKKLTLPKLTENIFSGGCCFRFVSGTKVVQDRQEGQLLSGESLIEMEVPFLALTVTGKGWMSSAFWVEWMIDQMEKA